jgi:hypothetical protein
MVAAFMGIKPTTAKSSDAATNPSALVGELMHLEGAAPVPHDVSPRKPTMRFDND